MSSATYFISPPSIKEIACSTDDPEGIAGGILKLRDNPDLRKVYADNAQRYGKAVYTRTVNTGLYEKLYHYVSTMH